VQIAVEIVGDDNVRPYDNRVDDDDNVDVTVDNDQVNGNEQMTKFMTHPRIQWMTRVASIFTMTRPFS